MKKIILLSAILICSQSAISQALIKPGYVLLSEGDTLRGEIFVEMPFVMKTEVRFRLIGVKKFTGYTPATATGFYYEKNKVFDLISIDGEKVFLRRLVQGYYTLYSFPVNKGNDVFYLVKEDGSQIKLNNTTSGTSVGEGTYKRQNYEYIATLKLAMIDNPDLRPKIDKARLDEKAMVAIVSEYNAFKAGGVKSAD